MKRTQEESHDSDFTEGSESVAVPSPQVLRIRTALRASVDAELKGQPGQAIDEIMQGVSWKVKVAACETREDYLAFFRHLSISQSTWRKPRVLSEKGYGILCKCIRERHNSWEEFLIFMGQPEINSDILTLPYTVQVTACERDASKYRQLFILHNLKDETWRNQQKLNESKFGGLVQAIVKVHGSWLNFLRFIAQDDLSRGDVNLLLVPYTLQVEICEKNPENYLKLFVMYGFAEDVWRNGQALVRAGHEGLRGALYDAHESWQGFLNVMPSAQSTQEKPLSIEERVVACQKNPEKYRQLFTALAIPEKIWTKSKQLARSSRRNKRLRDAIREEHGDWSEFVKIMEGCDMTCINESLLKRPFAEQVAVCNFERANYLLLFSLHKIEEKIWRCSSSLKRQGFQYLYKELTSAHNGWENFLAVMDGTDEETLEAKILSLKLEDAVALLAHQPSKLRAYLSIAHPDLLPTEVDRLVSHSFKRLHARRVYDYGDFQQTLAPVSMTQAPSRTQEAAATLNILAAGADTLLVQSEHSTRRLKVGDDGQCVARIALGIGRRNVLQIIPLNHGQKAMGPATEVIIHQTGEPDDVSALVALLDEMGQDALEAMRTDPGRHEYVVRQAEQVLIRKFSGSFAKGKAYVETLIAEAKSPAVRKVLKAVLKRFVQIDKMEHPNVKKSAPLYFFQKYCVAEIQRAMEEGKRGIVLANDPGLGKTRTALVAVNGDLATIVTPNAVVSSWTEEAQRALVDPDILVLQGMHSRDRKEELRTTTARHCVTNVEFLRATEEDERYGLLSNGDTIVVQDEAHGLLNLGSEQSKGSRRLTHKFLLLLSATPAKDPQTLRRILHLLEPEDPRFSSDAAFGKAFPGNDPEALKTLSVLKQRYMIRFTKEDVLETMDPTKPVSQQRHRLPKKEYVPEEQMGSFTLTDDQCQATYELFLNFPAWSKKYDRYVPRDEVARLDQLRGNSHALVKTHALRQTANNPSYIGSSELDPKAQEMQRVVEAMLKEGRKVVIFCQYHAQAEKYAELFRVHCPSLYTGVTSRQGQRTDATGAVIYYKQDAIGRWVMDARGLPQEDPSGLPMSALDYERLAFQAAPERRLMIATYAAGSVGVTFTAGKATIFDDLPDDVVREIQAEDRTHRIDHEHQTHHDVKYVRMVARYPQAFLERMKTVWVRKKADGSYEEVRSRRTAEREGLESAYDAFFAQGSYDEVRLAGLITQRVRFRLINDGIEDASELPDIENLLVV
jgi:superfamily II DNA or RNA helicase